MWSTGQDVNRSTLNVYFERKMNTLCLFSFLKKYLIANTLDGIGMNYFLLNQTISQLDPGLDLASKKIQLFGKDMGELEKGSVDSKNAWDVIDRELVVEKAIQPGSSLRMAIACDAGLGKSTNMEWLVSRMARDPECQQLPLLLRLDGTGQLRNPDSLNLELLKKEGEAPGSLLDWFAGRLAHCGSVTKEGVRKHLDTMQSDGKITLILDGLDHALGDKDFVSTLQRIVSESDRWAKCPIWVAGRPYALEHCWMALTQKGNWDFFRVNPLEEPEIRQFLELNVGLDVFDQLAHSRELIGVPRLLNLICGIVRGKLAGKTTESTQREAVKGLGLKNPADVYSRAYFDEGPEGINDAWGLLGQGLIGLGKGVGLQGSRRPTDINLGQRVKKMADLVGAIAFTIMATKTISDSAEPNMIGLDSATLLKELDNKISISGIFPISEIDTQLEGLKTINNNTIKYLLFQDTGTKEPGRWVFHDRTVQSFFAAFWAMKHGTEVDRNLLLKWKVGIRGGILSGYDEFWQFAAQMPPKVFAEDLALQPHEGQRWLETFGPSYCHPHELESTGDSTWWRQRIQWHRRAIFWSHQAMETWMKVLENFNGLNNLDNGVSQTWKGTLKRWRKGSELLAAQIHSAWRRCPNDPKLCGPQKFLMGSPETEKGRFLNETKHWGEVIPFECQEFPVTNGQYRIFYNKHPITKDISYLDHQPVVNLSFWDAWCLAYWVGCRLGTEMEWEFACRAGTTSSFSFGELDFDNHEEIQKNLNCGYLLKKTTTQSHGYLPNGWGLVDMHGNVFEWCDSIFAPGSVERVLKGGCWEIHPRRCRSANRRRDSPDASTENYGMRLFRDIL